MKERSNAGAFPARVALRANALERQLSSFFRSISEPHSNHLLREVGPIGSTSQEGDVGVFTICPSQPSPPSLFSSTNKVEHLTRPLHPCKEKKRTSAHKPRAASCVRLCCSLRPSAWYEYKNIVAIAAAKK